MIEVEINAIPENDPIEMIKEINPIPNSASLASEGDSSPENTKVSESKNGLARRNSTGEIGMPYKGVKILSRYLAASSSSCHDICKYGTMQDLDTKTSVSPILKTIAEKHDKGHHMRRTLSLAEGKKKPAFSTISYSGSKIDRLDIPITPRKQVSSSTNKESLFRQLSLPLKGIVSKPRTFLSRSSTLPTKGNLTTKEYDDDIREKKVTVTSSANLNGASGSRKQTTTSYAKKVMSQSSLSALQSVKKVLRRPIFSLTPKRSGNKASSPKTERIKSLNMVSHLNDHAEVRKAESQQASIEDIPENASHVIEQNEGLMQSSNSSRSLSSLHKDETIKHSRKGRSPVQLSPTAKITRGTQRGHVSQSPLSPTQHGHANQSPLSPDSRGDRSSILSLASSKSTHSNNSSQYHDTDIGKRLVSPKSESKSRLVKDGAVSTKDKDSPARKLSFGKGKVHENCHAVNPSRRLNFKQRSLSDTPVIDVEKVASNLKKTRVVIDNVEANVKKSEDDKVVLKHQDVEEKKAEQILLNNVIEVTANKLAETRKSKVRVLVGAFETVISLQDSRSLSTIDAL